MNTFDLCGGSGGLSKGAKAAGLKVVFTLEKDPATAATYARNHGRHVVIGDVNQMHPAAVALHPNAIIGGPPCLPFSECGLNLGAADERDAMPGMLRWIEYHQPDWFVIENVPGLRRRHREYLDGVLTQLRSYGYLVDFVILNASRYGVPQSRERLFVAGRLDGRLWAWPQSSAQPMAWGPVLLPMLKARKPDSENLPTWATSRRDIPEYALLRGVMSNGKGGNSVLYRLPNEPAFTVTTQRKTCTHVKTPWGCYRLKKDEQAVLQGFPADYDFESIAEIGNAVPPPLATQVLRAVAYPMGVNL